MGLREDIDLHVTVQAIARFVVHANTETSIANQCIQPVQLFCQRLGYLVHLFQVFEVAFAPLHLADIAPFLERLLGLVGVVLLVREEIDLGWVVLEEVGNDTIADASGATCYDVDLVIN